MVLGSLVSAFACGGLFCEPPPPELGVVPVEQSGEAALFAVDEATGTVTMHVQVSYEGPADDFAWVIPVPAEPEVLPSTPRLFGFLQGATEPIWETMYRTTGCFDEASESDADTDADTDSDADTDVDVDSGPGVTVVGSASVGPYETVTLTANSSDDLVAWLQGNAFSVPSTAAELLAPYLGDTTHFVALRLASDRDAGDIEPFALRYPGTEPALPIRLTAVAVQDDIPIDVYVLGDHRAVPLNYLHVQPNPFRAYWERRGGEQPELYAAAADEAGGQAFATMYAGAVPGMLWEADVEFLKNADSFDAWQSSLVMTGLAGLTEVEMEAVLPTPEGFPDTGFDLYSCPECYPEWDVPFDPVAATDALHEVVVEPARRLNQLLAAHDTLTRLHTRMSGHEMTLDPRFGLAPGLPPVSNWNSILVHTRCALGREDSYKAPQHISVGSMVVQAPSQAALGGQPWQEWLREQTDFDALVIEQYGPDGFEILVDHRPELEALGAGPCGCQTQSTAGGLGVLLVGLWLRLFRRRRG